jgi:hypothetical protein
MQKAAQSRAKACAASPIEREIAFCPEFSAGGCGLASRGRSSSSQLVTLPLHVQTSLMTGFLAWIYHDWVEQRSGESVRRLDITQPNENATRRFFCDRL